jgi:Rad3-related DNA helicase
MVLGQGVDGSPRQLWQIYQEQEKVVLLGAGNFWEGLEELPVSPTCLIVTRLPMPALNDPALAARAGQVSDQLNQFTVPVAALRMRRTLNRLLWNEQKRNALVVFDRRLISKPYGATILHSLPDCTQREAAVSHIPDMILDWLADETPSGQD